MSVFQVGTDQYDKLFLEFIKPGMYTQYIANTIVYDRFKTDVESCLGKYGVMKLATASSKSARPSSSSTYPTALQGSYAEFIFYMKRGMYATLQFDGLALAVGKDDGAVENIVSEEVDGQTIYISNRLNRQFWGNGSGVLATLNAASANSTTVSIDSALFGLDSNEYTNPANYLEEGQAVDIRNGTTGVLEAEEVIISTITDDLDGTATLVMASAVTASDNAVIMDHDTYATTEAAGTGVPMGIAGIISTSNQTVGITALSAFQNVNRSTYAWAQAQSFDMGSIAIEDETVIKMIQKQEKYGRVNALLTNGVIWRKWSTILKADNSMVNETMLWGGNEGIVFYGGRKGKIPIIMDDDCPDNTVYSIDDSKIVISAPSRAGMDFVKGRNGILQDVAGKDEMVANLKWYYNMTTSQPKALAKLINVKHASS